MFKRNMSLDKKLFERKSHPNIPKLHPNAGNPPGAGKQYPDAGEDLLDAGKPPLSLGKPAANAGKPVFTSGKEYPDAGKPIEKASTEEILEVINVGSGNREQKPVMEKTMSVSSTSSEKEIDEDPTSVSDVERGGRRKTKTFSVVNILDQGVSLLT